jgi:nucleotide-binding universal stress UspA family protein
MFKTILVATDGSADSDKAIAGAIEFARQVDGKLVALSVVEPYPFPPIAESAYIGGSEAYEQRALELANAHVAKVKSAADAAQIPCETAVGFSLNPHEEIIAAAQKYKCDAIFMATHGRKGLEKLFAGSVTQKVIGQAPVPVMVFR